MEEVACVGTVILPDKLRVYVPGGMEEVACAGTVILPDKLRSGAIPGKRSTKPETLQEK